MLVTPPGMPPVSDFDFVFDFDFDFDFDVVALCRELGIGIVVYSPLGRGFFTGAITSLGELKEEDHRRHNPRFIEMEANLK